MINIELTINEFGNLKELRVEGHSNFEVKGKDIVCAAVSVLVETAYLSILALFKSKNKEEDIIYSEKKDKNIFWFVIKKNCEEIKKELNGITLFLITGLKEIEKSYNKYVKFDIKRS